MTEPDVPRTYTEAECQESVDAAVGTVATLCHMVLQEAEALMVAQQEEVNTLQLLVSQQDDLLNAQSKQVTRLREENKQWYKNPVYVSILGFLAGGLTIAILER